MSSRSLIVVSIVALAAAAPVGARLTADHVSVPDAVGDGDPDITQITAGSNGSGGLTFIVDIGNRTDLAADEFVQVFIDSDHNPATGTQPNGVDFALQMDSEEVVLFRWDGTTYVPLPNSSAYGYVYKGFRFGVRQSDIAAAAGGAISYWAATVSGEKGDDAPDGKIAEVKLSTTPLQLSVTQFAATKTVKVGKRYTAGMRALRNDLEETTSAGIVTCSTKLGKKVLKVEAVFPEDIAGCIGTAPKAAKGKTLKVTVSLELDGVTVSRTASIKVR
jgi:hypothetical protein